MSIAGLILAAGQARRFGSDKRQAVLPTGMTMLETVLSCYAQVFEPLLVVIKPDDDFAIELCGIYQAIPVVNVDPTQGMGRSLAVGLEPLQSWPAITGVVVGLADMPAASVQVLHQLKSHLFESDQAVAPRYQGQLGHPRGIPANLFAPLMQLSGDQGAKAILDWQKALHLDVDCPGVLQDADTPDDLAQFNAPAKNQPAVGQPDQ